MRTRERTIVPFLIPYPMPLLDAAFPERATLPACARALLAALYPTVRWDDVTFHPVIPGYLLRFTNAAVTLPDPLSLRHIRIFIAREKWGGERMSRELLGILVHEAYHVLQYQQRLRGMGLGPVRPFVLQYLAAAIAKGGGRANRFEAPAYAHEDAFLAAYDRLSIPLCAGATPAASRAALDELLRIAPTLVVRRADP